MPGGEDVAKELSGQVAQVAVGEPVREQLEHQQGSEQRVGAGVGEPKPGDPGALVCDHRVVDGVEDVVTSGRVVAESLDAEQAPVGGEADLAECGQVGQWFRRS